jgi:magnesium chelatase family protein
MFASIRSSCLVGLDAVSIDVEVNLRNGQPRFSIIGLGGAAVRESKERILAALEFCGFDPPGQILVNLAPAELRKESSVFDLPIAIAILVAMGVVPADRTARAVFCGELSLTGEVKRLTGAVAHGLHALKGGVKQIFVPKEDAVETAVVREIDVVPVISLAQTLRILGGKEEPSRAIPAEIEQRPGTRSLHDVVGQQPTKEALIVAAAGGHNMLMVGPPGCGKSMIAERLSLILPPLSSEEMLEVVQVHSVAGQATASILQGVRPFRAPHHVISEPGLIGGGSGPRPGEISLAHRGVLFLDEFPEFRRGTLEALRAPLECGRVQLARARASVHFPARFQLIAAMNPCPCGRLGGSSGVCRCSHYAVRDYLARLSQPILDRIDLQVELDGINVEDLAYSERVSGRDDAEIRESIANARRKQMDRFGCLNSEVSDVQMREQSEQTASARTLLAEATRKLGVSARGYMRLLRVARTIADLAGSATVSEEATAQALGYRCLERLHNIINSGSSLRISAH